jgi:hypothetical protein
MRSKWELICDRRIVDTVHLRSTEGDRDRWLDKDIMTRDLSICPIGGELSGDRRELDDIWLLRYISSLRREPSSLSIPDTDAHR